MNNRKSIQKYNFKLTLSESYSILNKPYTNSDTTKNPTFNENIFIDLLLCDKLNYKMIEIVEIHLNKLNNRNSKKNILSKKILSNNSILGGFKNNNIDNDCNSFNLRKTKKIKISD